MFLKAQYLAAGLICACVVAPANAQPGDGVPDLYYNSDHGIITIDTDTNDMMVLVVTPPTPELFVPIFEPPEPGWTTGLLNDAWQFVRTNPLGSPGIVGVFDVLQGPAGIPINEFPSPGGIMVGFQGPTWTLEFTKVPEPGTGMLGLFAVMSIACLGRARAGVS